MNWPLWIKGLKGLWNSIKRFYKNQESGKGKRPYEQSSNEKRKGSSKGKKVECFNYRCLGHYAQDFPSPKDAKKSMQATWSDSHSGKKKNVSTASEDAWYNPNDLLAFITSMEFVHDSDDDELTDEQRA